MGCVSCGNDNSPCGKSRKELVSLKNQIVTLHNTSKDAEERAKHKEILSDIKSINGCPDRATLNSLEHYIENERIKRNK